MSDNPKADASSESSPELEANIISRILFHWAQPIFRRASELRREDKALEEPDLLPLPTIDHGETIAPVFEQAWSDQMEKLKARAGITGSSDGGSSTGEPSLRGAIKKVIGRRFIIAGIIKAVNTCLQFTFPLLLNAILAYIEQASRGQFEGEFPWYDKYRGFWLSALLFLAMGSKALTENTYFHSVYRSSYQARVAISLAVYQKALRLAPSERNSKTLGELINLMQVDATKVEMFVPQFHVLWDGLLQISGYMAILYTLIGWPCFAGMGVMILAGPIQGIIMKKLFGLNRAMVKYTDARVKTTNEAVQGIRCVKMYTWETSFANMIDESRGNELTFLGKVAYLRGFSRAYMGALPGIVAVVSFAVYATGTDFPLINASTLFAALTAFDQLKFPLMFYPVALAQLAQAQVSARRLEDFLGLKDIDGCDGEDAKIRADAGEDTMRDPSIPAKANGVHKRNDTSLKYGEISVKDVTVYWGEPDVPITKQDNDDDTGSVGSKSSKSSKSSKKGDKIVDTTVADAEMQSNVELRYPKPILTDVNLSIVPGELWAIVGRVGSGKTTLCSAILNETVIGTGSLGMKGRIAYAAQSPWILNATLRDNITFGLPFDAEKYDKIVQACQLEHDLDLLDFGDMTEIGENGINLSGGQKQRVSIARAAYSDADIIVLDDPLSALDPEVGQKLFEECILKIMKGKTRVLVTNQLQCLRFCTSVVALGEGRILEQGTFEEISKNEGEVQRLLDELKSSKGSSADESENDSGRERSDSIMSVGNKRDGVKDPSSPTKEKKENTGLVTEEERNIGAVSWRVYTKYIQAGGGVVHFIFACFMFILCVANGLLNSAWVAYWTSDSNYERHSQDFYLLVYAGAAVALGLFTFLRSYFLAKFGVKASLELHKKLLISVFNAPMSFFDTTPTGRILSRFSKDLYSIDLELSEYLDFFIYCSLTVAVSLATITFATPWFGIAILPLALMYVKILNFFRDVSRETKRLDSISRSPVFAHFSETLGGLGTIRAYGQAGRFIDDFGKKVDMNTQTYYNNRCADRWLSVRLELLGSVVGGLAAVFASSTAIASDTSSSFASIAGLSLTSAVSVTGLLNWVVRSFAQMEAGMNAAERVLFYTENIPQEAPFEAKDLEVLAGKTLPQVDKAPSPAAVVATKAKGIEKPDANWPSKGNITLNNLKMRYRPENPLVIKGLDVEIKGGERVGVVGRTGSGKSSLLLTLLRIVEPALPMGDTSYEAPITIDGVDALRIGLTDLRSKIGIIPQNPVLFSGTIRSNMDPFTQHTEEEIWNAIERCGMKEAIEAMPELLDGPVAEYGENLSQGQRQLLCLGRALLKKCRILLLDEATSSVDYETDANIQRTLREDFAGCTVLTIAHRVNTIMDSDKILVMKDGKVGEFDSPETLLADESSIFTDIVKHSRAEQH